MDSCKRNDLTLALRQDCEVKHSINSQLHQQQQHQVPIDGVHFQNSFLSQQQVDMRDKPAVLSAVGCLETCCHDSAAYCPLPFKTTSADSLCSSDTDTSLLRSVKMPARKRSQAQLGELHRDMTYYEKRRKNNESARKSREARQHKEELIISDVNNLKEENMRLRAEYKLLSQQSTELLAQLYGRSATI